MNGLRRQGNMRRGIAAIGTVVMLAFAASALLFTVAAPAFADDIIPTIDPTDPPVDPPPVDDPVDDIIDEVDDIVDEVGDVVDGVGDAIDSGTGGGGSDGGGSDGGGSDGGAGDGTSGGGGGSDGGSVGGSGDGKGGGKGGGAKGAGGAGQGGPFAWSWTGPSYQMRNFDTRLVYRPFTDGVTSSNDPSRSMSGGGAGEPPGDTVEVEFASDSSAAPGARHVWLLLPLAVLALACVAFAVFESEPPSSDRA
jgi:hypothetical protein